MEKANYRELIYSRYASSRKREISPEGLIKNIEKRKPYFNWIITKFFPANKAAKVLDLGCGYGALLYCASKKGYQNLFGVEISEQEVQCAQSLGLHRITHSDALSYLDKHDKENFDLIICFDIFEHLHKDELYELLFAIKRVLKNKGKCLVQTVNAQSPFFGNIRYSDFTHENAFTRSSMEQIFQSAGMKTIQFSECVQIIHGIRSLIRRVMWSFLKYFYVFLLKLEPVGDPGPYILSQNLLAVAEKDDNEK